MVEGGLLVDFQGRSRGIFEESPLWYHDSNGNLVLLG
jgi:hypothetical protein